MKSCSLRSASRTYAQPTTNRNGKAATPSSSHGRPTPNTRAPADRRRDGEQQRQPAQPDATTTAEPQRQRELGPDQAADQRLADPGLLGQLGAGAVGRRCRATSASTIRVRGAAVRVARRPR